MYNDDGDDVDSKKKQEVSENTIAAAESVMIDYCCTMVVDVCSTPAPAVVPMTNDTHHASDNDVSAVADDDDTAASAAAAAADTIIDCNDDVAVAAATATATFCDGNSVDESSFDNTERRRQTKITVSHSSTLPPQQQQGGSDSLYDNYSNDYYSEKQRLLQLPFALVFAATLADLATTASGSSSCASTGSTSRECIDNDTTLIEPQQKRNELFHRLQTIWMNHQHEQPPPTLLKQQQQQQQQAAGRRRRQQQLRYYKWSPSLVLSSSLTSSSAEIAASSPTNHNNRSAATMIATIQTQLHQRRDEMIQEATDAQQQLLSLQQLMDDTNENSIHEKSKSSKSSTASKQQSRLNKSRRRVAATGRHGRQWTNENQPPSATLSDVDYNNIDSESDDNEDKRIVVNTNNYHLDDTNARNPNTDTYDDMDNDRHFVTDSKTITISGTDWQHVQIRRKVNIGISDHDTYGNHDPSGTNFNEMVPTGCITQLQPPPLPPSSSSSVLQEQSMNQDGNVMIGPLYDCCTALSSVATDATPTEFDRRRRRCQSNNNEATTTHNIEVSTSVILAGVSNMDDADESCTHDAILNDCNRNDGVDNQRDDGSQQYLPEQPLSEKIQQLELQLERARMQLAEERHAAQKTLQLERDTSYERIQALQLRLYISETRLQTYEDALEQHIESVQHNIATPTPPVSSSCNIGSEDTISSPGRRRMTQSVTALSSMDVLSPTKVPLLYARCTELKSPQLI